MFVQHDVSEVASNGRPICVHEFTELNEDVSDEDVVKGLNDSEDERTTALVDGFGYDGPDVTIPLREGPIIAGLLPCPNKKNLEDEDYVSEELDSSDPDNSEDEKGL